MSDLFSTGLSGLNVARTALLTTAHNTANVYTPGYSRQSVEVSTTPAQGTSGGYIGTGARVTSVVRNFDGFLNAQLTQADSSAAGLDSYATQIGRIDDLLADRTSGLSTMMQGFFSSVQDVADTPADPAARQQMLSSAQALAGKFRSTDTYLSDLNSSVNEQISGSVDQINGLASQIANLNKQISQLSAAAGGEPPNDLLDSRDQLVSQLSKLVGVTVVQQDGGMYNLFVGSGHTLVLGDRAATMEAVPSAADPTRTAVAMKTFAGTAVELKDTDITGGSLGGLAAFRSQTLISTQNAIGRLAATLATTVNTQHMQGVDLNGKPGQPLFTFSGPQAFANAHNAGSLGIAAGITDTSKLTTSEYSVQVQGANFVVTRLSDGQQVPATLVGVDPTNFSSLTFDGVTIKPTGGAPVTGDSFLVQPTRAGARDLAVAIVDPSQVAAGGPVVTATTTAAAATVGTVTVDSTYASAPLSAPVTLTYDSAGNLTGFPGPVTVTANGVSTSYAAGAPVPYTSGATLSFGGMSTAISGAPAPGDTFVLAANASGASDGTNALAIAGVQRQAVLDGSATLNGAYAGLVSSVGNQAQDVQIASASQASLAGQVRASQQSVSGVNQDEEAANLMQYQQMYQANAKVIQAASTIFNTILGLQ